MFAYCYSNPVKFIDSWGLLPLLLFEAQPVAFGEEGTPPDSTHPKDVPPDHPDFTPPKKGNKKKKNPDGKGWGWVDKDGNIWEWFPDMHGGAGWIIHKPKGGHGHAYPGGGRRNHFDMIPVQLSDVWDFQRYPQTSSLTNIQGHFTHEMAAQPALFGGAVFALIYLVIFDSEYFNLNEG